MENFMTNFKTDVMPNSHQDRIKVFNSEADLDNFVINSNPNNATLPFICLAIVFKNLSISTGNVKNVYDYKIR